MSTDSNSVGSNSVGGDSMLINRREFLLHGHEVDASSILPNEFMAMIKEAQKIIDLDHCSFCTPERMQTVLYTLEYTGVPFAKEVPKKVEFRPIVHASWLKEHRLHFCAALFHRAHFRAVEESEWNNDYLTERFLFVSRSGWVLLKRRLSRVTQSGTSLITVEDFTFGTISDADVLAVIERYPSIGIQILRGILDLANGAVEMKERFLKDVQKKRDAIFELCCHIKGF